MPSWAALSAVSSDYAHLRAPVLRAGMVQAIRHAADILRSNDKPTAALRAGFFTSVFPIHDAWNNHVHHAYRFEKHVGESTVHDFGPIGPPEEEQEFPNQQAVFLFGENTAARFVVRIAHFGMYYVSFTEPGRVTTDADRAALATIRTVVWPAVSAAFGLTAGDKALFDAEIARKA